MHEQIDALVREVRSGRRIELSELEDAYTSGCAEVLALEAEAARARRRVEDLRGELRHIRTAIDWLQEQKRSGLGPEL
jgi:hypothetical protein